MARSGESRDRQASDAARGLEWFDGETRETLGRRRWRQAPLTQPALAWTLVLVLVLHALFAVALWYEMQPGSRQAAAATAEGDQALIVRLIDHAGKPPVAPPPEPPPLPAQPVPSQPVPPARTNTTTREPTRREAAAVQDHPAASAPTAPIAMPSATSMFGKDGSIRLPSTTATPPAPAPADDGQAKAKDDRQIMQHDSNRMHYKATRFEKYFPPPNETAGGAVGRHIGDAIKEITKGICDPTKSSTAANLLCGAPPPPASSMDRDERLNLPPPPLVKDPNPPSAPSLSSCIAEYRDGKPLSSGCPVNTPDLAFKAEMRECIDLFRAGKRLKTWCPADTPQRAAAEPSPAESSSTPAH